MSLRMNEVLILGASDSLGLNTSLTEAHSEFEGGGVNWRFGCPTGSYRCSTRQDADGRR